MRRQQAVLFGAELETHGLHGCDPWPKLWIKFTPSTQEFPRIAFSLIRRGSLWYLQRREQSSERPHRRCMKSSWIKSLFEKSQGIELFHREHFLRYSSPLWGFPEGMCCSPSLVAVQPDCLLDGLLLFIIALDRRESFWSHCDSISITESPYNSYQAAFLGWLIRQVAQLYSIRLFNWFARTSGV